MKKIIVLSLAALFLSGCASVPQFYPNARYDQVGKKGAKEDIKNCTQKADEYLESPEVKKTLKGAGTGALIGGAVGIVSGLFSGNVVTSGAEGAAIGGTAGGVAGALSPDQVRKNFIDKCLRDKGYDVIGWS